MKAFSILTALIVFLGSLSGCAGGGGGGHNGGGGGEGGTNASPGGIWAGTDSISGLQVNGIVDEAGEFSFIRTDGVQYFGTLTVSGSSVSANLQVVPEWSTTFSDGSTHGAGTLSGTVVARSGISANVQFTTSKGTASSGTLTLHFVSLYNTGSSLAAISGNYTDPSTGDTVSVSSSGVIFEQQPSIGCVTNGNVSIIDASYDAYSLSFKVASCTGAFAVLNGAQFSGLVSLNTNASPNEIGGAVYAQINGIPVGLIILFNRQ